MTALLLVVVGLAALVAGGELLVRGATSLALATGLSPAVVGLTVVAIGTSLPELAVSVSAALSGSPDLAVGNVVGSNIYNVLLILGVAAMVRPCRLQGQTVQLEWPMLLLASASLPLVARDQLVSRAEGAVFAAVLCAFLGWMVWRSRRLVPAMEEQLAEAVPEVPPSTLAAVGSALAGCAVLVAGAQALVGGATTLAEAAGVSERVIGLTVVAVGTSLPELSASVVASYRGHDDVAVGNVVGSNLFNLLGILGASACITPLPVSAAMGRDLGWMVGAAVVLGVAFAPRGQMGRWRGALLVALAVVYTVGLTV